MSGDEALNGEIMIESQKLLDCVPTEVNLKNFFLRGEIIKVRGIFNQ